MPDLSAFIAGLPKAELHMHVEGSLEPEMMFALARRNRVSLPFATVESARAAYRFASLQDFLDIYYQGASVLKVEEDFSDLARAYFERASKDRVTHSEIFFDPQTHTARGLPFGVAAEGLLAGMAEGEARFGVSSRLILCFLRHLSEEDAFLTLRAAEPWLDRIAGIGLDSGELGHPPAKFARVFEEAGRLGLKRVAHAGEEGPPAYVAEAMDLLRIDRLDHGNRALEDETLVARLVEEGVTLTVCPLSNVRLKVVEDAERHPLARMLRRGLRVTVNSDDPAYFGGYVNDNYLAVMGSLTREEVITLARNSFLGSFLPPREMALRLEEIDAYLAGPGRTDPSGAAG
jgi:adenosine deaminase